MLFVCGCSVILDDAVFFRMLGHWNYQVRSLARCCPLPRPCTACLTFWRCLCPWPDSAHHDAHSGVSSLRGGASCARPVSGPSGGAHRVRRCQPGCLCCRGCRCCRCRCSCGRCRRGRLGCSFSRRSGRWQAVVCRRASRTRTALVLLELLLLLLLKAQVGPAPTLPAARRAANLHCLLSILQAPV